MSEPFSWAQFVFGIIQLTGWTVEYVLWDVSLRSLLMLTNTVGGSDRDEKERKPKHGKMTTTELKFKMRQMGLKVM